jgi:hypothetical protein
MKIYENGNNWLIEDQLDDILLTRMNDLLDNSLDKLLKDKEGYSTTGENIEQYWLINRGSNFSFRDEEFKNIENEYRRQILGRLNRSEFLNKRRQSKITLKNDKNCWSVIGGEHSFHQPHIHNIGSFDGISTLVYLKVPETNDEDRAENKLFAILDCNPTNKYYQIQTKIVTINPTVGKVLIFPDWIVHGTHPQSKGIRQTFNIDYTLTLKSESSLNYS